MKDIFKRFLFYLIIILFLEFCFSFLIFDSYLRTTLINIFIYSWIIASIFSIMSTIINKNIVNYILFTILGLMYSLQFVFYKTLKSFFSFSVLAIGDQLTTFFVDTLKAILLNSYGLLLFFLPLILFIIFRKKMNFNTPKLKSSLIYFCILIISICSYLININLNKNTEMGIYELYNEINDNDLNIQNTGILSSYNLDFYRLIFGFDFKYVEANNEVKEDTSIFTYPMNNMELNFDKKTSNSEIKTINNYMKKETGTAKNKYSGLFDGYNLIYITAESFSEIGVREDLTPTLYKLVNSGFTFKNFYTPNNLSTIGGEFQSTTGLFANNSILSKWRSGTNYFPFGLGKVFKEKNYNTYSYHNHYYNFQDRNKYLASLGFTNYKGCYNGLEKVVNCKIWPESDIEMMKGTVNDYINSDKPFFTYYMTVSGHKNYTWGGNNMARKNRNLVKDLPYSDDIKAYLATQIELDRSLEYLLNELEKAKKLDNTIIVLLADHYPYGLSTNSINQISNYPRDSIVEVNHNSLIIYNSKLKKMNIDKVCMSIDVLPTVLNLFNIPYDSRTIIGKDIFSNESGLAFFANHSFVTEYGTYFASNNKFIGEVPNKDYIKNMNNVINNRINMSKMIVKNDYYRYLFK